MQKRKGSKTADTARYTFVFPHLHLANDVFTNLCRSEHSISLEKRLLARENSRDVTPPAPLDMRYPTLRAVGPWWSFVELACGVGILGKGFSSAAKAGKLPSE